MTIAGIRYDFTGKIIGAPEGQDLVSGEWWYSLTNPLEITAEFYQQGMETKWVFARDLLREGLYVQTGEGDVTVGPERGDNGEHLVAMLLSTPMGSALVHFDWDVVHNFISRTLDLVPAGTENVDFDEELAELLGNQ